MDLELRGRVALVAAASQGLGKASAFGLAREGARVVICSRDEARIRSAADEIRAATGTEVLPIAADVSRAEDCEKLVRAAIEGFGRIDVLVNNAGGPPAGDFLNLDDEAWEAGIRLTVMSVVRLTRLVLPDMLRRRWGRVITISSIAARQPVPDLVLSSALRPGILGLHKALAARHSADGVLFNCVAPGFILTARQDEIAKARSGERGLDREQYLDEVARDIPMRRLGRPEELADAVVFLASERASYINGAVLGVDGGLVRGLY